MVIVPSRNVETILYTLLLELLLSLHSPTIV